MLIEREAGHVRVRDRAALHWALGLFLLGGGVIAIAAPLGLATNAAALASWERLAIIALGLGVSAGALWWLWQVLRASAAATSTECMKLSACGRRLWRNA